MRQNTSYGKAFAITLVSSLLFFFEFGLNNIFNALQPHITLALNLSPTDVGFISSLFFYVEIALLIPAGLLLDKYSPKKIILIILSISIMGVILTALAHSMVMLFFARILMGIGGAFGFIGCVRVAVNWLHQKHLAQGISLIASMGIFGGFAVQTPLTYAISTIGWRVSLLAVGIIGLTIFSLIALVVKDRPKKEDYPLLSMVPSVDGMTLIRRFKAAFLNKQNFVCGLYTSLMNLPIFMLGAMWGIASLTAVNQVSEMQAATICSMIFFGTMLGSPIIGFFSDKMGKRKLPMQVGALFSLLLILVIILYDPHNFILLMILYFALGFLTSTQMLSYPTVVESNAKLISSSATSVVSMLCMVGGAVAQPLFGYILNMDVSAAIVKNFKMAMWLLPVAFIIAFIAVNFVKETFCKSQELV